MFHLFITVLIVLAALSVAFIYEKAGHKLKQKNKLFYVSHR